MVVPRVTLRKGRKADNSAGVNTYASNLAEGLRRLGMLGTGRGSLRHAIDLPHVDASCDVVSLHDLIPLQQAGNSWQRAWSDHRLEIQGMETITPTQAVADQAVVRMGLDRRKITVIHHGVATEIFRPAQRSDLGPGRHVLLPGASAPHKNLPNALRALRMLRGGQVTVHMTGRWPGQTAPPPDIAGLKVIDHGVVTPGRLARLYSSVDLLLYPSLDEGFGLPPLEAAACGTPSVVVDRPVFRELWGDDIHYAASHGPVQLAAAVRAALAEPVDRASLLRRARRYTWERSLRKHVALYRRIARKR